MALVNVSLVLDVEGDPFENFTWIKSVYKGQFGDKSIVSSHLTDVSISESEVISEENSDGN
jgi:hypothetical protein